jgi:putative transposase
MGTVPIFSPFFQKVKILPVKGVFSYIQSEAMPRVARCLVDGAIYHILNRGNAKQEIYFDDQDYSHFLESTIQSKRQYNITVYAYCLMPNHYHFIVQAEVSSHIGQWIQLIMNKYNAYFRKKYKSIGHIWQNRFKNFIIQNEDHLTVVMRYVERNPVEAGLTMSSFAWRWSSHQERHLNSKLSLCDQKNIPLPKDWTDYVDTPLHAMEQQKLKRSMKRQTPFGDDIWIEKICDELGMVNTLRSVGRPKK